VILMKRAGATLPSRAPPLTMPALQSGREFQPSSEDRPPKPLRPASTIRSEAGLYSAVVSADSLFVLQSGEAQSPSKAVRVPLRRQDGSRRAWSWARLESDGR
jgi:hypothetical protein